MPTVKDVREYWQNNPLLSYEADPQAGEAFFAYLDRAKRTDSDRFALDYWDFGGYAGKLVLDVGCGPGWVSVNYALGGARVVALDLTRRAVDLARRHLAYRGASAHVLEGSAEAIPCQDNSFDLVVSSGVLHHTPDCQGAIRECARVLKPGGEAKITLYRKGLLHRPLVWPLVRTGMRLLKVKHPGADLAQDSRDVDDFIRQYDGAGNPVGIGHTDREWAERLAAAGFKVLGRRSHYFPVRFLPGSLPVPDWAARALDGRLGTMAYFQLQKL